MESTTRKKKQIKQTLRGDVGKDNSSNLFDKAPEAIRKEVKIGGLTITILTSFANREIGYGQSEAATSVSESIDLSFAVCVSRIRDLQNAGFLTKNQSTGNLQINPDGHALRDILIKKLKEFLK